MLGLQKINNVRLVSLNEKVQRKNMITDRISVYSSFFTGGDW